MASVEISEVHKYYGDSHAIRGVSVGIEDGGFNVLVGPSGCGKSTLLRMIAGLESISKGEISIGNVVVNRMTPKERDIAMVFQNYALYPHMTVYKNMEFSLKLARLNKADIKARVNNALKILGIDDLLDRYPRQLSGGQRQRVAMGRAMVRQPRVFLFDEPLSNLDAKLRVQMRRELRELHQRLSTTSIYVTHDQVEAMTMGDQIVVMNQGVVEQFGKPLDLYDHPANLFVARFLGSPAMNTLDGVVQRDSVDAQVELTNGVRLPLPPCGSDVKDGQRVVYGIRPENIEIGGEGQGIQSTIEVVEPTGANTELYCHVGDDTDIVAVPRRRYDVSAGDTVFLDFDPQQSHIFDAETERSLA